MYQLNKENTGAIKDGVMFVPFEPNNADYKAYLAWLEEGNTPEPAENL